MKESQIAKQNHNNFKSKNPLMYAKERDALITNLLNCEHPNWNLKLIFK